MPGSRPRRSPETMRARLRGLALGLSTILGLRRRGFFIPYRYAAAVVPADYPALEPIFAEARPRGADVLAAIESFAGDLRRIAGGEGPARFDQDWFPRLDAAAAYAIVRRERPTRIVEIGSGHSTRFLARAVVDERLPTRITCIDPAPRADLRRLTVEHVPVLLKDADPALFANLGRGDVLFIDSSHIAMPGTDADRLILDVLPRLRSGTLIHVHDITLPYAYPAEWGWRGYNEQIAVGALLLGGGFAIEFASQDATRSLAPLLQQGILGELPLRPTAHETSLWLRKR